MPAGAELSFQRFAAVRTLPRRRDHGGAAEIGHDAPGALAVRAAILAANGYTEPARNDARLVSANPLLPEERALIAPLLQ